MLPRLGVGYCGHTLLFDDVLADRQRVRHQARRAMLRLLRLATGHRVCRQRVASGPFAVSSVSRCTYAALGVSGDIQTEARSLMHVNPLVRSHRSVSLHNHASLSENCQVNLIE